MDLPKKKPDPFLFDVVLRPHRSLSPLGFLILMLIISSICFTAGLFFLLLGAWPVMGFFGLDVLAIYIAFRLNYRTGRAIETLQLSDSELLITRINPSGTKHRWAFHPYWLQVHMDNPPEPSSKLTLSSHGQSLTIGSFLTPDERAEVATALRKALASWRTPVNI